MIDFQGSNILRYGLLAAIGVVVLMLLIQWNKFQERHLPEIATNTTFSTPNDGAADVTPGPEQIPTPLVTAGNEEELPTVPTETVPQVQQRPAAPPSQHIHIVTDTLDVLIDSFGGDIVKVALPEYPVSLDEKNNPFILLNRNDSTIYIAQSGLIGPNGTDASITERPVFTIEKTEYQLATDQDAVAVDLHLQQDGINITKRFTFHRGEYLIDVDYLIDNQSTTPWSANLYGQIRRDDHKPVTATGVRVRSFLGGATTSPEDNYSKFSFKSIAKGNFEKSTHLGGWIALVQHYFISAWIPDAETQNTYTMNKLTGRDEYLLRFVGSSATVQAGQHGIIHSQFYAGPKDVNRMEEISPHLDMTIDFGWLWFIAKLLFVFLHWIHSYVGNWGLAIVILVVCLKLLLFHLSAAGYRSMAKMRKFTPKMQELKERYGDNRQKLSEEMMKLYKKEKVNPLGGCLPMLIQMPVFLSLYWVLMESVELRQAPFIFWIHDLSAQDPYFILPFIYAMTFWFQQKLNPTPPDPTQAKIMQMMPFVFGIMFLFFASGLVLYWVTNSILSILQQYVITKQIENADKKKSKAVT